MDVLMKNTRLGEKVFPLDQAQKMLCYQLRKGIKGKNSWELSDGFKYDIIEGESCCGGKGELVISKVSIKAKKSVK